MMFEDKRLEKKLLHLKESYDKIETVSDSEKILYNILNDADIKKPVKKFPFMYVASLATVILIGVFAGLSSYLGGGEKGEHETLLLDQNQYPESYDAPTPNYNKGLTSSDNSEDELSGESPESTISYEKQLSNNLLTLRKRAEEQLGTSDMNILDRLFSLSSMERLIRLHFTEAVTHNDSEEIIKQKYEEAATIIETFMEQVKFFKSDEIFEKQEALIIENYNRYKENYDDEVLIGLDPYEVMAIYLYANTIGDDKILWELLMKSKNHHYPTKEEWEGYPKSTEEDRQYWKDFIGEITYIEQNFDNYEDGAFIDAVIFLYMSENYEESGFVHGFQLSRNDQGIWKVDFMPLQ